VSAASGDVVFETPDHEAVPALVDEACAQIDGSAWHPAIAAAWLHVAIAAIHPFRDGNGRTARVLASLAMYRGGFRHPAFTSLEEWWGRHPSHHYAAFSCLGSSFDADADVTPFITTHVRAQVAQVRELAVRQQRDGLLWIALENLLDELTLPPRLANALYDSVFGRDVTTGYYRDLADTSPATARNDLSAARAAGLLASEGRTRGRRYLPGARLLPLLAEAIGAPEASERAIAATLARRAAAETTPPDRSARA
jgi:Fic family protein